MPAYSLADPVVATFFLLPICLALLLVWATATALRRQGRALLPTLLVTDLIATGWMAGTWFAASSGVLRQWDANPPSFLLLALGIFVLALALAGSSVGRALATLPLWMLVGVQAFRLPLELAMHAMYERGIMPEQMSYSGRNFDILTGISAIVVAALVRQGRARKLALVWNWIGLLLVLNIATIAILSTPRFRFFGDDHLNTWVTYPPFVWLPAVMVLAAVAGHLVVFRALSATRETADLRQ